MGREDLISLVEVYRAINEFEDKIKGVLGIDTTGGFIEEEVDDRLVTIIEHSSVYNLEDENDFEEFFEIIGNVGDLELVYSLLTEKRLHLIGGEVFEDMEDGIDG